MRRGTDIAVGALPCEFVLKLRARRYDDQSSPCGVVSGG